MREYEQTISILEKISGIKIDDPDMSLQNNLGLDSLEMVLLLVEIEDSFDIEIKESDMNPFDLKTVSDVVMLVERYTK